jgi:anti-sigma regulatory factor (Ser/Thr protein kinase)
VPWSKQTLTLPASPPSVRRARDWVADMLTDIGRGDLVPSARLCVSELMTNALLHAEPPLAVQVRGTVEHPRIEVADRSLVPPRPRPRAEIDSDDELTWTTFGRGLDLVAFHSVAWGADIDPRWPGKVVWFEPSPEPRETATPGELFDLDEAVATVGEPVADPASLIHLDLLGMPVELFTHLRNYFAELGREVRLLALGEPERYPDAVEFAEVYLQVEHERRQAGGLDALDRAMAAGRERVDLHYRVPPSAPRSMARLDELLTTIYESFFSGILLAPRLPPELLDLQHWYLGEFVRQGAGQTPIRWEGPTRMRRRREVS